MEKAAAHLNMSTRGLFFLMLFGLIVAGTCLTFLTRFMLNRRESNLEPRRRIKSSQVKGGPHSTVDSVLASRPAAPGSNLGVSKIFSEIIFSLLDVAELIDSKGQCNKKLNKLIEPIQYW